MPINDKTWQEWSHKVLDELVTLNKRYAELQQEIDGKYDLLHNGIDERYAHIERKLERMNELLTHPEKGLVIKVDRLEQSNVSNLPIRVDRLEQAEGRRTWLTRTTLVAAIGAVVAQLVAWWNTK